VLNKQTNMCYWCTSSDEEDYNKDEPIKWREWRSFCSKECFEAFRVKYIGSLKYKIAKGEKAKEKLENITNFVIENSNN
jgi:hypothetical protein